MRIYLYSVKLDCEKFPCYSRILNKFIIERERESLFDLSYHVYLYSIGRNTIMLDTITIKCYYRKSKKFNILFRENASLFLHKDNTEYIAENYK
jgi:hypothetical protein